MPIHIIQRMILPRSASLPRFIAPLRTIAPLYCSTSSPHSLPCPCLLHEQQARQSELIRRQEDRMDRDAPRFSRSTHSLRPMRSRQSRSRSPIRRTHSNRKRSRSPEPRKSSFRSSAPNTFRQDKLSACPVCLGRHRHHIASCQATKTWNGKEAISTRTASGRILNKRGAVICADWQRPNRCTDSSGKHLHECSGCGSAEHGADSCLSAQP